MKKGLVYILSGSLLLGGCGTPRKLNSIERAGIGADIGAFFGALFGREVGAAIDEDEGKAVGTMVGAMAGGVAGSTIAYNKAEREKAEPIRKNREYRLERGLMSIPLLKVEDCYVGDEEENSCSVQSGGPVFLYFEIANNGNHAAYDVKPEIKIEKRRSGLQLLPAEGIGDIAARSRIVCRVPVEAGRKVKKETVVSIRLVEAKGYGTEKVKFHVALDGDKRE